MTGHDQSQSVLPQDEGETATKEAARERVLAEARRNNRAGLFAALAAADITYVIVAFDGCGDNGQIESIEVRRVADPHIDLPSTDIDWIHAARETGEPERSRIPLAEAIETVVYTCLEEKHGGWEIDDGAYGEFAFDVAHRTITLDYYERYTGTNFSQHEF